MEATVKRPIVVRRFLIDGVTVTRKQYEEKMREVLPKCNVSRDEIMSRAYACQDKGETFSEKHLGTEFSVKPYETSYFMSNMVLSPGEFMEKLFAKAGPKLSEALDSLTDYGKWRDFEIVPSII